MEKQKKLGYMIRFGAVVIWGIDPIIIKYTPLSTIPIEMRVPLLILGATIFSLFVISFLKKSTIVDNYKVEINRYFFISVVSAISLSYLIVKSLEYTSSTNFIIFNIFSPVFALLLGLIFWRSKHHYFKNKKSIFLIFLTFIFGSLGGVSLFYNEVMLNKLSLLGLGFAFIYMLIDIVFVSSQIRYAKSIKKKQSYFMNLYLHGFSFLLLLPILILYYSSITIIQLSWVFLAGILWGLGTLLTYEAFRRIDGFLGYLMFNFTIVITIFLESLVLGKIDITYSLIFGVFLIVGSSVVAEKINTKCEGISGN